jgi:hypothetical protein
MTTREKALEEAREALLPVEPGLTPEWVESCKGHVNAGAGDPGKWPVCLRCAFAAIEKALVTAPVTDALREARERVAEREGKLASAVSALRDIAEIGCSDVGYNGFESRVHAAIAKYIGLPPPASWDALHSLLVPGPAATSQAATVGTEKP